MTGTRQASEKQLLLARMPAHPMLATQPQTPEVLLLLGRWLPDAAAPEPRAANRAQL